MTSTAMLPFGQWLKQRRKLLGLTQSALAGKVACAVVTIKKIEQGDLYPSRQLAELLAAYLDVPNGFRESFIQFARTSNRPASISFHLSPHFTSTAEIPDETHSYLPLPLTEFVGRERELASVVERLRRPEVRLLTLTGPPGAGKTRLSLQAASALRSHFGTVHFIELAPLNDPGQVLEVIAQACSVRETMGRPLKKALLARLQDRQMLLVLDNFEQVLSAASLVSDILTHGKGVKILVTSREALSIYGEHQFPVGPLETPNLNDMPVVQELQANPAVSLFVQRAQAAWPEFQLTESNAPDIVKICVQLDGLPLALEMAAGQIRWLPPDGLLAQLRARLAALRGSIHNLPERQQSLRGAIEWSYERLDPLERETFDRLAVFVGGGSLEAVWAILEKPENEGFLPPELEALIRKNLVQYTLPYQNPAGAPRIWMLETIRAFAVERLSLSGQAEHIRRAHAAYYTQFAETVQPYLNEAQQAEWLRRLEAENNNFRAALRWCVNHDPEMGLRLSVALQTFWSTFGHLTEGRSWMGELLLRRAQIPAALQAQALRVAGFLAHLQDDTLRSNTLLTEALKIFRQLGDQKYIADTLCILANVCLNENQYQQLEIFAREALSLFWDLENSLGVVAANTVLGYAAKEQGRYEEAIACHEDSLVICRANGNLRGIAAALLNLGNNFYWIGQYARTAELAQQSLEIYRELNHKMNMASSLEAVGMAKFKLGDSRQVMPLLEESLALYREMESQSGELLVLCGMGLVNFELGDSERAVKDFQEAFHLAHELGDKRRMAFCLEGLAGVWAAIHSAQAARLLGAAHTLREVIRSPLPPGEQSGYEATLKRTQTVLGSEGFSKAWAEGQQYSLPQILEAIGVNEA